MESAPDSGLDVGSQSDVTAEEHRMKLLTGFKDLFKEERKLKDEQVVIWSLPQAACRWPLPTAVLASCRLFASCPRTVVDSQCSSSSPALDVRHRPPSFGHHYCDKSKILLHSPRDLIQDQKLDEDPVVARTYFNSITFTASVCAKYFPAWLRARELPNVRARLYQRILNELHDGLLGFDPRDDSVEATDGDVGSTSSSKQPLASSSNSKQSHGGSKLPVAKRRNGDDNSDRQGKRQRPDGTMEGDDLESVELWDCPFRKAYPSYMRHSNACYGFRRISDVRQHINRNHAPKIHCPTCMTVFRDQAGRDAHVVAEGCVTPAEPPIFPYATLEQIGEMNNRTRRAQGGKVEERWYEIWDIMLRDIMLRPLARPSSPYIPVTASGSIIPMGGWIRRFENDGQVEAVIPLVVPRVLLAHGYDWPGMFRHFLGHLQAYADRGQRLQAAPIRGIPGLGVPDTHALEPTTTTGSTGLEAAPYVPVASRHAAFILPAQQTPGPTFYSPYASNEVVYYPQTLPPPPPPPDFDFSYLFSLTNEEDLVIDPSLFDDALNPGPPGGPS